MTILGKIKQALKSLEESVESIKPIKKEELPTVETADLMDTRSLEVAKKVKEKELRPA